MENLDLKFFLPGGPRSQIACTEKGNLAGNIEAKISNM